MGGLDHYSRVRSRLISLYANGLITQDELDRLSELATTEGYGQAGTTVDEIIEEIGVGLSDFEVLDGEGGL